MTRWQQADLDALQRRRKPKEQSAPPKPQAPRLANPGKPTTEDSLFEAILLLKLPAPERQYQFAAPQRKFRADFCWPDRHLVVEVEGQVHSIRGVREADIERRQWAHFNGWTIFAVSAKQVRSGEAIGLVERLLK